MLVLDFPPGGLAGLVAGAENNYFTVYWLKTNKQTNKTKKQTNKNNGFAPMELQMSVARCILEDKN
jgi:hypothetical protein